MAITFPDEKGLIDEINDHQVCLLLGAGFNVGLKNIFGGDFKLANTLMEHITKELFPNWSPEDIKFYNTLEKVITEAIKLGNKNQLSDILNNELTVKEENIIESYKLLKTVRWRRIYTLNADNVLDFIFKNDVLPLKNYKFPQSLEFHDKSWNHETQVIYLHGKLPCDIENELVFSFDAYTKESKENKNDLYEFFIRDFLTKPFIIIGVSFEDRDFHSYVHSTKERLKVDFSQSVCSYLIDINGSKQRSEQLKRDLNIIQIPNSSTADFLDWLKIIQNKLIPKSHPLTSFKHRFKKINLNEYDSFELSILRSEKVEEINIFEELCLDILRSPQNNLIQLRQNYNVILNLTDSKRLGVDFVLEKIKNKTEFIFIRCPYISEQSNVISGIDSFEGILSDELIFGMMNENTEWRQKKRITNYIICLPIQNPGASEKENFEQRIKDVINNFCSHSELFHLKETAIILVFWDELRNILNKDIYLYHKWFGSEPQYLSVIIDNFKIRERDIRVNEFRDYLKDEFLPYYSRKKFKMTLSSPEKNGFYDENELIDLLQSSTFTGIIIYGQGGIGKTRLMIQLGRILNRKGFSVIDVNKSFADFRILNEFLEPEGKYVLLFDYIEEQKEFSKIVEWIYDNKYTHVKFIANCRKSFLSVVEHLHRYNVKFVDIGIKNPLEKLYKEAVIKFIIDDMNDSNLKVILRGNRNIQSFLFERPSFAVFIRFIYQKHPTDISDLRNQNDFSNWLLLRLKLSLDTTNLNNKEFANEKKNIFKLFSSLRALKESSIKLKNDFSEDISNLISDGWIEEDENNNLTVVHDTVSDSLLAYYFRKKGEERIIGEFIEFAVRYNTLPSVIRSFERLFDIEEINENKRKVIETYLKRFIENLLDKDFENSSCYELVSFWLRRGNKPDLVKPLIRKTLESNLTPNKASVIIGFWLEEGNDPQLVKPYIQKCLDQGINPKSASYIIQYWLEKGDDPLLIKPFLSRYITYKLEHGSFSYIFQEWLNKGDDPNIINEIMYKWLFIETNQNLKGNVIKHYIHLGGNLLIIQDQAVKWLDDNKKSSLGISIVGFWLDRLPGNHDNKEILDVLEKYVIGLLQRFGSLMVSGKIIGNWIIKGGKLTILIPFLTNWFSRHLDSIDAGFIMSWWMKKNGFPRYISEFIVPWLNLNASDKFTSELLFTWLRFGFDQNLIKDHLKPCLIKNIDQFEIKYTINTWLSLHGSPDKVRDFIKPWLNKFKNKPESIYLVRNWLINGDDISIVESYIKEDLNAFIITEENSNLVIEGWLYRQGNPLIVKDMLLSYIKTHLYSEHSIYLIRHWINSVRTDDAVKEFKKLILTRRNKRELSPLLRESFFSLRIIYYLKIFPINRKRVFPKTLKKITFKLERHLHERLNPNLIKKELKQYYSIMGYCKISNIVISKWLEFGNDFEFIKEFVIESLNICSINKELGSKMIGDCLFSCKEGFEVGESYILNWLNKYADSKEANYVLSSYLKGIDKFDLNTSKLQIVEAFLIPWLNKYYKIIDCEDVNKWRQDILIRYSPDWYPLVK